MTEDQDLLEVYMSRGLTEPFAKAIISGTDAKTKEIMKFWAMDWHKQYPDSEDLLVQAVLDGKLKPDDGEWLNSVRSNHEQLIQACIAGACLVDWARALIDAGFRDHPDSVLAVLSGAVPSVIASLDGIDTKGSECPPILDTPWKVSTPVEKLKRTGKVPSTKKSTTKKGKNTNSTLKVPRSIRDMPWFGKGVPSYHCPHCDAVYNNLIHRCIDCDGHITWKRSMLSPKQRASFPELCTSLSLNPKDSEAKNLTKIQNMFESLVTISEVPLKRLTNKSPNEQFLNKLSTVIGDLQNKSTTLEDKKIVMSYLYEEVGIRYYAVRSMIQHKKTLYKVAEKIEHWRGLND
jgi:hypothetical protein